MPNPSTRKPARRIAWSRSGDMASTRLVLMNCRASGSAPLAFAATIASQSGRTRLSFVNTKMSSWKMMVRTPGCAPTMRWIICTHSSASSRAMLATLPCASCRKLVEEQKVQPIGQ